MEIIEQMNSNAGNGIDPNVVVILAIAIVLVFIFSPLDSRIDK